MTEREHNISLACAAGIVVVGPLVRDLVLMLDEVKAAKESLAKTGDASHFKPRGDNGHSKAKN